MPLLFRIREGNGSKFIVFFEKLVIIIIFVE